MRGSLSAAAAGFARPHDCTVTTSSEEGKSIPNLLSRRKRRSRKGRTRSSSSILESFSGLSGFQGNSKRVDEVAASHGSVCHPFEQFLAHSRPAVVIVAQSLGLGFCTTVFERFVYLFVFIFEN